MDSEIVDLIESVILSGAEHLLRDDHLPSLHQVESLCAKVTSELQCDPIVLRLDGDYCVVGDIHGNFDDLLRIFESMGYPPDTSYVFLGDYVDRGRYSIEVLLLLYGLKVLFPGSLYLLRGNHETGSMTSFYGFETECRRRLNRDVYSIFLNTFQYLPLACVVNSATFCVHGGISPNLRTVAQLASMRKPAEFPRNGLVADILWSDPCSKADDFRPGARGIGHMFGPSALATFLSNNGLHVLVRSHEFCMTGYSWVFAADPNASRSCLTIFSCPNYCGQGNVGAVLSIKQGKEFALVEYSPMTEDMRQMRRIVLPDWLLANRWKDVINIVSDRNISSEPNLPGFDPEEVCLS
jgi:diadenosine tetraphosphatase ApaH/serine/threonine PP2A family protein phosphatase